MPTAELIAHLDELLQARRFADYCPNGLQVEGNGSVQRVVCGVTASLALVRAAARLDAQALLVHHGWFWRGDDPRVLGTRRERLAETLAAGLNLIAYHLPLDAHPELGNNARLGAVMGWEVAGRAGENELLCWADLPETRDARWLADGLAHALGRVPLLVGDLQRPIRRLAWCTGAAQDLLQQAIDLGADAFVSGEIAERTTHLAREASVIYAGAGHHATERHGIRALGAHLGRRFGLDVVFVDDPNPV